MKKMQLKTLTNLMVLASLFSSAGVLAHGVEFDRQCDLELNNELNITPKHILIKESDVTLVDIYNDEIIFVNGDEVTLDNEQQKLVTEYSLALRAAVPQVAEIAVDAVEVAFEGINAGLGNMVDLDNTRDKFEEIKSRINERYNENDGHYSFSEGNFSTNIEDEQIDDAVKDVIKDVAPQLIGKVLANIGNAMAEGNMDFSELDGLDARIENEIDDRTQELEQKAAVFCDNLKRVDKIEDTLMASNLKFIHLDLINLKRH